MEWRVVVEVMTGVDRELKSSHVLIIQLITERDRLNKDLEHAHSAIKALEVCRARRHVT